MFVPQGWRLDLVEIRDPVEQFEAMTAVAYDHHPMQQFAREVMPQFA